MPQQYLALITILTDGGSAQPPVISGPPGPWPTPPIAMPPGGTGGAPGGPVATPPIYYPPVISGPPGPWPTPPIAMPPGGGGAQPPLVIWGPDDPRPTNPIVIPPGSIAPGVPTHPIFLPVYPSHPIVLPPEGGTPPEQPEQPPVEVKVGWTAETGWVVVLVPTGEHPTPSR